MMPRLLPLLSAGFVAAVTVTNGLHPLLHAAEGGSLDAVLGYLNALSCQATCSIRQDWAGIGQSALRPDGRS